MGAIAEVPARVLAGQLEFSAAWERVLAKAGMPGVDGISVRRFARAAPALLRTLQARMARDLYQPLPLRVAEVEKKAGSRRLLLVPTVLDRVALSAAAHWLSVRWNPDFDPASFAYRPGMGVHDALRALADMRERGLRWVLDADVRSFFDSIDHTLIAAQLTEWLGEGSPMLAWLKSWLQAAVWDGEKVSRLERGVPQGSPLSPLLANYYLDTFDRRLRSRKIPFVRYADDFLVLARTPFELADHKGVVAEALASLRLELSEEKTRVTCFDTGFRFLGAENRSDAILLPFDKRKKRNKPVYVAPRMGPGILRAFRAGALQLRTWVWTPHPVADEKARALPQWRAQLSSSPHLEDLRRRPE